MRSELLSVLASCALVGGCAIGQDSPVARWTEPATDMVFVRVSGGQFTMGSPHGESGRDEQERQHQVTISRPFWVGAFEVTQGQWRRVMGANPSWFSGGGDQRPVENVTWFDVHEFLDRL